MKVRYRFPRTLCEAFGPYATGPIHPMPDDKESDVLAVALVCCTVALAVIGFVAAVVQGAPS